MVDVASKCSEEVLSKVIVELARVKADWAWEKEKAKQYFVDTKKEVTEAVKKLKAFEDFMVEKAHAIADLQKLEEFFILL